MDPEMVMADGHLAESVAVRRRSQSFSDDYSVQRTNDDATQCKLSAVQKFASGVENSRKDPEIHIGYWARVEAVYKEVVKFIAVTGGNCQIVSLGSGFDTLFWRLKQAGQHFIKFVEVDFSSVTARKIRHIRKPGSDLLEYFSESPREEQHCDLHCGNYHLVGADIRQWDELKAKLDTVHLDKDVPTFFLAECVLVYMSTDSSHYLLKNIAEYFSTAVFLNYEQFRTTDQFGKIMEKNLETRGIQLPGLAAAADEESATKRFTDAGWDAALVRDMNLVYKSLSKEDRQRIEQIERLDEMELLRQLLAHYSLAYAVVDKTRKYSESLAPKIAHPSD